MALAKVVDAKAVAEGQEPLNQESAEAVAEAGRGPSWMLASIAWGHRVLKVDEYSAAEVMHRWSATLSLLLIVLR